MGDELHRVIGIDLGTTYSAAAAYDSDEFSPAILSDPAYEGSAAIAMPSVVRLDRATGALVVGHEAKNAIGTGDSDTVIEIKREMGAVFDPKTLELFGAGGVYADKDPVHVKLGNVWLRPQEISALILMRIKDIAQKTLEGTIHDAVVTVPAYFTERQKKATEEAALLAGLYPRQLIPEPTAAAIAYGVDREESDRRVYLVFDLGGGTFDVSIIQAADDEIEVIATAGDRRLGGGDFDNAVRDWIDRQAGPALPEGTDPMVVKAAAEAAKRELSLLLSTTIDLGGTIPPLELDRATFETLIQEPLGRSLAQVEEALRFAKQAKDVERDDIDAVLLVGGSTRIPRVRKMLLDYFERDEDFVRGDANPDTLVARGAAIIGKKFEPTPEFDLATRPTAQSTEEQDYTVTLIAEHALGVGVEDELFSELIPRGTRIPARQVKTYSNPDQAENIRVTIYQGEGQYIYAKTIELIGTIHLDNIEPRPEGHHKFEVEFSLDENGLLGVHVTHANVGREYEATFDQSTTIGKLDELALRRTALAGLYANGAAPQATPPKAPSMVTIPPPVSSAANPADDNADRG
jgi:molecular chaperone DnaK (HSP70)